jgi:Transposase IS116/IS110/IS902 family
VRRLIRPLRYACRAKRPRKSLLSDRLAGRDIIGRDIIRCVEEALVNLRARHKAVFRSGREFAAWLGLVPRQNSTGGKTRLGGITKRGNRFINGASANLDPTALRRGRVVFLISATEAPLSGLFCCPHINLKAIGPALHRREGSFSKELDRCFAHQSFTRSPVMVSFGPIIRLTA